MTPDLPPEAHELRQALAEQLGLITRYEALASFFRGEGERMLFEDETFLASIKVAVTFPERPEPQHGEDIATQHLEAIIKANLALLIRTMLNSQAQAVRQLLAEKG